MNTRTSTWTVALILGVGAVAVAQISPRAVQPTQPWIIGVTHVHHSITVWSDGSIDVSDPIILTSRAARRLARRLEQAEETSKAIAERTRATAAHALATAARARETASQPPVATSQRTIDPDVTRCQATAVSTGQQCRKRAVGSTGRCSIHVVVK